MKLRRFLQQEDGISRRKLFDLVKEGKVFVNNVVVEDFSRDLISGDIVTMRNKSYTYVGSDSSSNEIILFNKPKGLVVSKSDEHNKTIFAVLPSGWQKKYYYIGRLDKDSHGLLLLVDDTILVNELEHPSKGHEKVYHVLVSGFFSSEALSKAHSGLYVDRNGQLDSKDGELLSCEIKILSKNKKESLLEIILSAGKNRHIRRVIRGLGYHILDLKRISFGPYKLGNIELGSYEKQLLVH